MTTTDILLVDDDPGAIQVMGQLVSGMGRTRFATCGADALRLAREHQPDLMLLDAEMPGMSGFRVCEEMKSDQALRRVPVVFVTSHDDPDFQLASFQFGASDYITKPVNPALAVARIQAHLRANQETADLRRLLTVDPLTEAANRRGFTQALQSEWRRALRGGRAIALLMVDVDQFEPLRQALGDTTCNIVLKRVAHAVRRECRRPGDLVARIGEHRFAVILPDTPRAGAEHVAHRVIDAIEALNVTHPASAVARHVTASVGMGCHDEDSAQWIEPSPDTAFARGQKEAGSADDLYQAAFVALRAAKFGGGAQGWMIDAADVDTPRLAREIQAASRPRQQRVKPVGEPVIVALTGEAGEPLRH